jgi:hypothetical protein
MLYLQICSLKPTKLRGIEILQFSHKELVFQPKYFNLTNPEFEGSRSRTKMHKNIYTWSAQRNPNPNTSESKEQVVQKHPTKLAWKRHKKRSSQKKEIDATMKVSIHSEVRFSTKWWRKSKPMGLGNEKHSRWNICLETLELYIWSPPGSGKWPSYP